MGGIGNIRGAVLGGLIIGVVQQLCRLPARHGVDRGSDLRLPDPRDGAAAARPARRGDEGGGMSELQGTAAGVARRAGSGACPRAPRWLGGRWKRPGMRAGIAFLIVFPLLFSRASGFLQATIIALAYVVMALGLNIVIGFAGLLDLGYVAFYALGAYAVGWFASDFFFAANINVLSSATPGAIGIHLNFILVLICAVIVTSIAGHDHRPADAAPARRLHRDRDARLRRDHRHVGHQRLDRSTLGRPDADRRQPRHLLARPAVLPGDRRRSACSA